MTSGRKMIPEIIIILDIYLFLMPCFPAKPQLREPFSNLEDKEISFLFKRKEDQITDKTTVDYDWVWPNYNLLRKNNLKNKRQDKIQELTCFFDKSCQSENDFERHKDDKTSQGTTLSGEAIEKDHLESFFDNKNIFFMRKMSNSTIRNGFSDKHEPSGTNCPVLVCALLSRIKRNKEIFVKKAEGNPLKRVRDLKLENLKMKSRPKLKSRRYDLSFLDFPFDLEGHRIEKPKQGKSN
ncbi:uncharacterized protein LOC106672059 [Cimex lectularius]|uniref:Uncharacterized protein n=1 Tax=Cimex lectularius TaxID=79782 RepID=A0A8I6S854_CIMLE|nr:uncharacterized protein LOC106672059 [Cimex lectularius]